MRLYTTLLCFLFSFSLFSEECCSQNYTLFCPEITPGYNAPLFQPCSSPRPYSFGSFLYLKASQENMELGAKTLIEGAINVGASNFLILDLKQNAINLPFRFHPGYQVGVGLLFANDHWDLKASFTQYNVKNHVQVSTGAPSFILPSRAPFSTAFLSSLITLDLYEFAKESWDLEMYLLDLELSREGYFGKNLSLKMGAGLRGALIDQSLSATYLFANPAQLSSFLDQSSHSLGVGPQCSFDLSWMIRNYFRIFATAEADVLHTWYPKLKYQTISSGTVFNDGDFETIENDFKQNDFSILRPHLEYSLGIGLKSPFLPNKGFFDLQLSYTFHVFFNQNMFRYFEDSLISALSTSPNGNLYVEGLVVRGQLNF